MTEDEVSRCLEPFFTTKGTLGTGLGLAAVYGFVQRYGGSLGIDTSKGHGACFTIKLPAAAALLPVAHGEAPPNKRALRVLVVDDQEMIREIIAEMLRVEGHTANPVEDGVAVLWMGDLETDFMEAVENALDLPRVDILFAPHHGRDSGKIPESMLTKMSPKIIVIGEAPSEHLNYYVGYNTITQNSAGNIVFECEHKKVHVFTSNPYEVGFLDDESKTRSGFHYVGTLDLDLSE